MNSDTYHQLANRGHRIAAHVAELLDRQPVIDVIPRDQRYALIVGAQRALEDGVSYDLTNAILEQLEVIVVHHVGAQLAGALREVITAPIVFGNAASGVDWAVRLGEALTYVNGVRRDVLGLDQLTTVDLDEQPAPA